MAEQATTNLTDQERRARDSREKYNALIAATADAVNSVPDWVQFYPQEPSGKPLIHVTYESFVRLFAGRKVSKKDTCLRATDELANWITFAPEVEAKECVLPAAPAEEVARA